VVLPGEGRFGHEVIAITMKTIGAEMRNIFEGTMRGRVFVVGQPVVQYLPGRNAEGENDQQ